MALALGGGERVEDGVEGLAEGAIGGGTVERAGAVGDGLDRGEMVAMQVVIGAGDALDVGPKVDREGAGGVALDVVAR